MMPMIFPRDCRSRSIREHCGGRGIWRVFVLVLLLPLTGYAQEWTYRVQPGDTLWELAAAHLRAGIGWQRLQEHNRVQDPLRLAAGRTLRFPLAWLGQQAGTARLVALHGRAEVSDSGTFTDARTATDAMALAAGAAVRTAEGASLTLEFADGSRLNLRGNSEVQLSRLRVYGRTGMVDTRLRLVRGRAGSQVADSQGPGSHYSVELPGMMSSVRGTRFRTTAGDGSRSEVLHGVVEVSGGNRAVLVQAGHGSQLDAAGHPSSPVALLPAPDLSAWPHTVTRLPLTLAWPEVPGAAGYRMEASTTPGFDTLVQDVTTRTAQASLHVEDEGAAWVRVRAVNGQGLEGLDATAELTIAAQPAPPFMLAPDAGAVVAAARPRLMWTQAEERALRYRVQLVDVHDAASLPVPADSFAAPLAESGNLQRSQWRVPGDLPPGAYAWRVAAVRADGTAGPWSDPVAFTLVPAGDGSELAARADDRTITVHWQQGEPGQRHQFQLARTADFARPLRDELLDTTTITLPDLRSGTWYMRTRILDGDGYAHPFGPVQQVRIGCRACRVLAGAGAAAFILVVL